MNSSMYRAHGSTFKIAVCDRKNSVSLSGSKKYYKRKVCCFINTPFSV